MITQAGRDQAGFTLIEMMAVVAMIAVLAVMALPSYTQYVRRGAADEARSSMLGLAEDLQRFQSKNFTFKGYVPLQGYSNANKEIYLPQGSTLIDYRYKLTLLDGSDWASTLPGTSQGQSWVLIAEPNPSHRVLKSGNKVVLTSYGLRCQTVGSVDYANKNCGTSGETW